MLRRNILLECEMIDPYNSKIIVVPDEYKRINVTGKIIDVADRCLKISKKDLGKKAVMGITKNENLRITPDKSKSFGLSSNWHFIVHEDKILSVIE